MRALFGLAGSENVTTSPDSVARPPAWWRQHADRPAAQQLSLVRSSSVSRLGSAETLIRSSSQSAVLQVSTRPWALQRGITTATGYFPFKDQWHGRTASADDLLFRAHSLLPGRPNAVAPGDRHQYALPHQPVTFPGRSRRPRPCGEPALAPTDGRAASNRRQVPARMPPGLLFPMQIIRQLDYVGRIQ